MKTNFKNLICLTLVVVMLFFCIPFGVFAVEEPTISVNADTVTITMADEINYIRFALGEYKTSAEIKKAETYVGVDAAHVAAATKDGVYTRMLTKSGTYTFWWRMNDGKTYLETVEVRAADPVFTPDGLQLHISDLANIKVIRSAYGDYETTGQIKRAPGCRNFTAKYDIKGADEYTIQYRDNGLVTVSAEYYNGYIEIFQFEAGKKTPAFEQDGDTVRIGDIDGLYIVRYAPGVWATSGEIKRAPGAKYIRPAEAVDGVITVVLEPGVYSFSIQYKDDSYNYYTVTVEDPNAPCEHVWGDWNVTLEPTYITEGEEQRACTLCGETETRTVAVLVCTHEWGEWTVVTPATEEAEGVEERACTLCGEKEERAIPKLEPVVVPTATRVHVSCAFSDNMILQRDEKLSVWGTADANSGDVVVSLGGKTASAKVDAYGNWKATFKDTFSYTTDGQPLVIGGADYSITFNDVLIGDVYYAVGQSNIFYSLAELMIDLQLKGMSNTLDVDFDNRRDIRFYRISNTDYVNMSGVFAQGTTTLYSDVYNGGNWMIPTDIANQIIPYISNMPTSQIYERTAISTNCFSALGYLFAYNMSNRSDVPVGVIEIDASGHPLITFAPNELADKWGHDVLGSDGRYFYYLHSGLYNTTMRTRYAYNQQIYPLSGFSCAGIIWYQGESDMHNTKEAFGREYNNNFPVQFTELMTYFRQTFGNDDFPVYLVEYPTCNNNPEVISMDFGAVRSELGTIPQLLDNSYIVSSSDMWNDPTWQNNVHPYIKHWQATRLADIVAAQKHGIGDLNKVHGPLLREVNYTDISKAELKFDYVDEGLTTLDGTGYVKGIEVQIEYNGQLIWLPHEGEVIVGKDTIMIDTGEFPLFGVRYNRQLTAKFPETLNLCNSYKMPAIAFVNYRMP
ncbi:MAG: hypothetical protein IJA55_06845 [Clostridia bacterium]|nr:hypothetical protein [Clostridia bacterium]